MANLNVLLRKPWFHLRFKLLGAMNLVLFSSVMNHVIHVTELRAETFTIEKVVTVHNYKIIHQCLKSVS